VRWKSVEPFRTDRSAVSGKRPALKTTFVKSPNCLHKTKTKRASWCIWMTELYKLEANTFCKPLKRQSILDLSEGHGTGLPGYPGSQSATDLHKMCKMTALPSAAAVATSRLCQHCSVTHDITRHHRWSLLNTLHTDRPTDWGDVSLWKWIIVQPSKGCS